MWVRPGNSKKGLHIRKDPDCIMETGNNPDFSECALMEVCVLQVLSSFVYVKVSVESGTCITYN